MTTYIIRLAADKKTADIHGVSPRGQQVVAINDTHIVLKTKGFTENVGSRYSGLRSYVSPQTTVYSIVGETECGDLRVTVAISYDNARK